MLSFQNQCTKSKTFGILEMATMNVYMKVANFPSWEFVYIGGIGWSQVPKKIRQTLRLQGIVPRSSSIIICKHTKSKSYYGLVYGKQVHADYGQGSIEIFTVITLKEGKGFFASSDIFFLVPCLIRHLHSTNYVYMAIERREKIFNFVNKTYRRSDFGRIIIKGKYRGQAGPGWIIAGFLTVTPYIKIVTLDLTRVLLSLDNCVFGSDKADKIIKEIQ